MEMTTPLQKIQNEEDTPPSRSPTTPVGFSGNTSSEEGSDGSDSESNGHDKGDVCPICLCPYEEPAMVDSCFHTFCFLCILQWSQVGDSPRCPLCKQEYASLIYDVTSEAEYKRHFVRADLLKKALLHKKKVDFVAEYNSKFGKKHRSSIPVSLPFSTAHALRRAVYLRRLKAIPFDVKSSSRPFSPQVFQSNPSFWENKLRPWLTRELQALLEEEDVELLVVFVLSVLQQKDIRSEGKEHLNDILFEHVDTFVHEFLNFANSPYDMHSYDRLVQYDYSNAKQSSYKRKDKKDQKNSKHQKGPKESSAKRKDIKNREPNSAEYHQLKDALNKVDEEIINLQTELEAVQENLRSKRQRLEQHLSKR